MKKIVTDPKIMLGKPTIAGTRITVELILNLIEHGQTIPDIMEDYNLTKDQILTAVNYVKKLLDETYPPQRAIVKL